MASPRYVKGLVKADFPTVPWNIDEGEVKALPDDQMVAADILASGHVVETNAPATEKAKQPSKEKSEG